MRIIESSDLERMEFKTKVGLGGLVRGLTFVAFGALFVSVPFRHADHPQYAFVPFGLVFVALGVASAFGRTGATLDRRKRTVTAWWGVAGLRFGKSRPIDLFDRVEIAGDVPPQLSCPVNLRGRDACVQIGASKEYAAAYKCAEEAARFLHLRLVDDTGQEEMAREPEELDESLRDRAKRLGIELARPPAPPDTRIVLQVRDNGLRIEIPPPGFRFPHYFVMVIGFGCAAYALTILTILVLAVLLEEQTEYATTITALLWAGAVGIFPLYAAVRVGLRPATRRATVEVSPSLLRVTERAFLRHRVSEIQSRDLAGLAIVGPDESERARDPARYLHMEERPAIRAHSTGTTIAFGEGLTDAELAWLKTVIEKTLTV